MEDKEIAVKTEMRIITERPDGMPYEQYKMLLKIQDKVLRHKKKGRLIWLSKLEATPGVLKYLAENDMINTTGKLIDKGVSFKGSIKDLNN